MFIGSDGVGLFNANAAEGPRGEAEAEDAGALAVRLEASEEEVREVFPEGGLKEDGDLVAGVRVLDAGEREDDFAL